MKYQAIFFDFDGVLADSVEVKTQAFAKLFSVYGEEIEAEVVGHHRRNGGMTRKDKFRYYYKEYLKRPLSKEEMERLCHRFSSLVVEEVISSPKIPGSIEFLEKYNKKSLFFVISATPDEEIIEIVNRRGLTHYFCEVLGSSNSKQKNIEMVLKKYGLQPKECLFFGDAESDYKAAMNYRINFIGIVPGSDAPLLKIAPKIKWARNFVNLTL